MNKIRVAEVEDFGLLAELGRRAFFEAFGAYNDPSDMQAYLDLAFDPESIKNQLADNNITFLLAYLHDEPVGYAKILRNSKYPALEGKKAIQLERIYALQDFIGKKVGKALMVEVIKIAKTEAFNCIWLSVWQENTRAIDFYKRWGFIIIGYKQFVIGKEVNDDFVMALELNVHM